MPSTHRGSHPARAVEPTPRLHALCVENNAALQSSNDTPVLVLRLQTVWQLVTQKNAKTESAVN
ncbi:hypothetical protein J8M21_11345 [Pseudoalteromonas luteoviolacea]|uniref:hypothetical protein n=1 Tax=Pseudoalteromonas luteoviolacea TaxID=43657 RepID=UPI001B3A1D0E|nr:hypothetical protein [Pseudoalteromonas luteoviolacea]MBQ4877801.1 hypothetical protein [Pseudoalteromonas luteoviolacea]MBQ4906753.1 hypothetical protein [Pseudoalteromonas luteoviolacea]